MNIFIRKLLCNIKQSHRTSRPKPWSDVISLLVLYTQLFSGFYLLSLLSICTQTRNDNVTPLPYKAWKVLIDILNPSTPYFHPFGKHPALKGGIYLICKRAMKEIVSLRGIHGSSLLDRAYPTKQNVPYNNVLAYLIWHHSAKFSASHLQKTNLTSQLPSIKDLEAFRQLPLICLNKYI